MSICTQWEFIVNLQENKANKNQNVFQVELKTRRCAVVQRLDPPNLLRTCLMAGYGLFCLENWLICLKGPWAEETESRGTDLMIWGLVKIHDMTGAKGPEDFQIFSPHPWVHSHVGCQEAKLLLNWWSAAMSLLSDSGKNNQKVREAACCSRRNMGFKQRTYFGLNPGFFMF